MSITEYCPERASAAAEPEQPGHGDAGCGQTGMEVGPGAAGEALGQVAAGMRGGAGRGEFRAGIEAGQRELGNRAFMQWVGELQSGGRDAPAADGAAPLQMMGGGKKKTPEAGAGARPGETAPGSTPANAGNGAAGPSSGTPAQAGAGMAGGTGMPPVKHKKKPNRRLEIAKQTLREEGVEALGNYIEAAIGKMTGLGAKQTFLRNLERWLKHGRGLEQLRTGALSLVEARLRALGPEEVAAGTGVNPLAQLWSRYRQGAGGQQPALAPIAPVKFAMSPLEQDLFAACSRGDTGQFEHLSAFSGSNVNIATEFGPLLCHAAYGGHERIVNELLSRPGVDVNLAGRHGATPLSLAAQEGHAEVVELLLCKHDIKVNLSTIQEVTPFHVAADKGHAEVVKLLLAAPGIDIDRQKSDGATALYLAAGQNFPGIVEQFVRTGADANLALFEGTTPLYTAAFRGHIEVVRVLLQAPGIRVNPAVGERFIPLGAAAQQGHENIARLLLRNGADPNVKSATGLTSLHVACLHGHTPIVVMLLHFGAEPDVEAEDSGGQGQTPYSLAGLGRHCDAMSVLEVYRRRREAPAGDRGTLPPGETVHGTEPSTSLAQAKNTLRAELLDKFLPHHIDRQESAQLLEVVDTAADLDSLCALYNGLAHIERGRWRGGSDTDAAEFALGEKTGLDADGIGREIKVHLGGAYYHFVSQAVNDMEFGRGKPVEGYPGLWHATAGVPGVGSCIVFYYLEESAERNRIRVVGIGHHLDAGAYWLDYAARELGGAGRVLRID